MMRHVARSGGSVVVGAVMGTVVTVLAGQKTTVAGTSRGWQRLADYWLTRNRIGRRATRSTRTIEASIESCYMQLGDLCNPEDAPWQKLLNRLMKSRSRRRGVTDSSGDLDVRDFCV